MKVDRFQNRRKTVAGRAAQDGVVTHYRNRGEEKGVLHDLSQSQHVSKDPSFFENDPSLIDWVLDLAEESPTARVLAACARAKGWSCRLDDLGGAGHRADAQDKILHIDHFGFKTSAISRSAHYRNIIALNLVKGLRRIWHSERAADGVSELRPDAALMLSRALAADCETIAVLVAWEWRGAGHVEPWRVLLGAEEGDMAMIFTRALEKDPSGFYDGSVLARVFCQWYADTARIGACDAASLAALDEGLKLQKAGGRAALAPRHVEAVSAVSGGAAYLAGMGGAICSDPYFLSMDDAINEAHLFQIIHDCTAHIAGGVAFRDASLARKIFPPSRVKLPE